MEDLLSTIITGLPNLAVALIMLWWQRQTINELMATQQKLIDRLLDYVDNDKQRAQQVLSAQAVKDGEATRSARP